MMKLYKLKGNLFEVGLIAGAALIIIGCSQITTHNTPDGTASFPIEPVQVTAPASPNEGDVTQMIPPPSTSSNPSLQSLIEKAREHLAQQLSISITQISLVEAVEVTWPDSSIGCPQDGMVYAQVLTPGYLILLGHDGNTFEYHASKGNYVVTCTNPSPPVPGMPDNT